MARLKHVIESQQFDRQFLESVFSVTNDMKKNPDSSLLKDKLMTCLFYEPSTRTRFSFESAMNRLGGQVMVTDNAGMFSSAAKGETLEDTIRVMSAYTDVIVLRHKEEGSAKRAAEVSSVPIINAGDGSGQHPTQALLDIYTINDCLGSPDGKHIGIAGDLKYGRTARSLAYLLTKFEDVQVTFISPSQLRMGEDIVNHCLEKGTEVREVNSLETVLPSLDCIYMTRTQQERMTAKEYEETKGKFILTPELVRTMKKDAIILHPLPRIDEIPVAVDEDRRAKYFVQAKNGLYIRMALLQELFG